VLLELVFRLIINHQSLSIEITRILEAGVVGRSTSVSVAILCKSRSSYPNNDRVPPLLCPFPTWLALPFRATAIRVVGISHLQGSISRNLTPRGGGAVLLI
jgi:hypothetical protein